MFYRDIMTNGESERIYTEARRKGVLFIWELVGEALILKEADAAPS